MATTPSSPKPTSSGASTKKGAMPIRRDCRGVVFNPQCRGTRRNSKTYWCEPCEPLADKNCSLTPDRLVKAVSEKFTQTNKQYLLQHRCKRLKLNDDSIICYVLETTENARVVAQTEGLELLTKEDYDGDEIIYHWSGKHKKYLHGPRPSARTPSIQCKAHGCSQPGNRSCQFEYCYVDCIERQKQIRESQHIALSLGHRPANFDTPKCVVHQPKKRKRSSASSAGSGMSGPTSPVFHHPGEDMMLGLARPRQRRATMPGVLPFGGPPGGLPGGFNPFTAFGTAGGLAGANGFNAALAQQFKGFADPALALLGLPPNAFAPKQMSSGAMGGNATNGLLASGGGMGSAAQGSLPPRRNTMPAWPYPGAPLLPFHAPGQPGHATNEALMKAAVDAMIGQHHASMSNASNVDARAAAGNMAEEFNKVLQMAARRGSTGALSSEAQQASNAAAAAAAAGRLNDFQRRHSHSHSSAQYMRPNAFRSPPPTISEELIDEETMKSDTEIHQHQHHHSDHDMLDAAQGDKDSVDAHMKHEPSQEAVAQPPPSSPHQHHPQQHHVQQHNGGHRGSDASILTASGDSRRSSSSSELSHSTSSSIANGAVGRRSSTSSHASSSSRTSSSPRAPKGCLPSAISVNQSPSSGMDVGAMALLSGAANGGDMNHGRYGSGAQGGFSPHASHPSVNGLQQQRSQPMTSSPYNARSPTDENLARMLKAQFPAGLSELESETLSTMNWRVDRPPTTGMLNSHMNHFNSAFSGDKKCGSPSSLASAASGNSAPTSPMVTDHHQPSPTSSGASYTNGLSPAAAAFGAAARLLGGQGGGSGPRDTGAPSAGAPFMGSSSSPFGNMSSGGILNTL